MDGEARRGRLRFLLAAEEEQCGARAEADAADDEADDGERLRRSRAVVEVRALLRAGVASVAGGVALLGVDAIGVRAVALRLEGENGAAGHAEDAHAEGGGGRDGQRLLGVV